MRFFIFKKLRALLLLYHLMGLGACSGKSSLVQLQSRNEGSQQNEGSSDDSVVDPQVFAEEIKVPMPEEIDFEVVQKNVFQVGRCVDCHTSNGNKADDQAQLFGLNLDSYGSLFVLNGVVAGDLKNSKAYQAGQSEDNHPNTQGYNPLSPASLEILRLWIINCAVENYRIEKITEFIPEALPAGKIRLCH